jgi:hypothetical protein
LYAGGSELWRSTDEGESWAQVNSTPLVRADKKTMGASGGPITKDQTGVETYATIFAFDESPVKKGVLWTGSDDGIVSVSQDNGKTWTAVTPPAIAPGSAGEFARISIIEPSPYAVGTAYVAANRYGLNDFSPYLFKTTDFGATWSRLDAGLPRDVFTRVIRVDPVRPGLLYVGTERGVYVSLDEGAHWRTLSLNLPKVPVHDMTIKDGDLVAATHGRSFWILDDLSPLRQVTTETLAKNTLYQPREAVRAAGGGGFGGGGGGIAGANPPAGTVFHYVLKSASQPVSFTVMDSAGRTIRTFESATDSILKADSIARAAAEADEDAPPQRPRPPRPANKAGHNVFVWNHRYPEAVSFDGMILWAAAPIGPVAVPGTYQVRMVAGTDTVVRKFVVKQDPRSTATPADMKEQFRFAMQIRDRFSEANETVTGIRTVKGDVTKRAGDVLPADAAEYKAIADRLAKRVSSTEGEIYQVQNRSSQDPLNFPIKLNNKIGALQGVVGGGDFKPTKQAYTVYGELSGKLQVQLDETKKAYAEELPKLNALLRKAGKPPINPPGPKTAS